MAGQMVDPVAQFKFELQIDELAVGWFTEYTGMTIEREVVAHVEGGRLDYQHQLPGPLKRRSLTLKRGLANETLWQWLQEGRLDGQVKRRNVSVVLYHPDGSVARSWDLTNVYPSKWTGSTLKTDSRQVALETLELAQSGDSSASEAVQRAADSAGPLPPGPAPADGVDVEVLARKIYNLLKQDLKRDQERTGVSYR